VGLCSGFLPASLGADAKDAVGKPAEEKVVIDILPLPSITFHPIAINSH
jgi:hypothetical protein